MSEWICSECGYGAERPWPLCPQCQDPGAVCAPPAELDWAEAELRERGHL